MGSNAFLAPLIGLAGIFIGVLAVVVISRMRADRNTSQSKRKEKSETMPDKPESILVLGEPVDLRELRILRALFGEPKGRYLGCYKDKYYWPSLEATLRKGWVKQRGNRYVLTPKGGDFCRTYFEQLLHEHEPAAKA